MKRCEYCNRGEDVIKVVTSNKFGDKMTLCEAHYAQMNRNGELKNIQKKNRIMINGNVAEVHMYSNSGEHSGISLISTKHIHIIENNQFYIANYDHTSYALTNVYRDGKRRTIGLHMLIAEDEYGACPEGMSVDHLNRNGLDNRIENIKYKTFTEQNINQKLNKRNTSGVKGVSLFKRTNQWRVRINYKGKSYGDRLFDDFDMAVEYRKELEELRDRGELI